MQYVLQCFEAKLSKERGNGTDLCSSMLQVLGTRFRAGFVYNMGDEEASKDAGQQATAVYTQSDDDLKLCS